MEIGEIRKLVELMEEKGLMELEVEDRKGKIRLVRENHHAAPVPTPALVPAAIAASPPIIQTPAPSGMGEGREEEHAGKNGLTVNSPMVGTFYRAPSPEAEPYVDVGNVVNQGDVLCVIEAMKMMNEIEAEFQGRIVKVLVENAQPVEYEQPLFLIEPSQEA